MLSSSVSSYKDADNRRRQRWKEVRFLWNLIQQDKYSKGNIENALWYYGHKGLSTNHFVMILINEFGFENSLHIDNNLRRLYQSFVTNETELETCIDWRDILSSLKLLTFYHLVKTRTIDLLIILFDLYASNGGESINDHPNDSWYIPNKSQNLIKIFHLPCETSHQLMCMTDFLHRALDTSKCGLNISIRITRIKFKKILKDAPYLVEYWQRLAWEKLPTELRLQALDEAQLIAMSNADVIMYRYKLKQAIGIYSRSIYRKMFKDWLVFTLEQSKVRSFGRIRFVRLRNAYIKFWRQYARRKITRRRKRLLAEVMGLYAIKARIFARIKLFNYNTKRLAAVVGKADLSIRVSQLGGYHLREYYRLTRMKSFFHRWWNECVILINTEISIHHNNRWIVQQITRHWFKYAHREHLQKRHEAMVQENKVKFDRMLAEVDDVNAELFRQEMLREQRIKKAADEAREADKTRRLEEAKIRAQKMKAEDVTLSMKMQREVRRMVLRGNIKAMKKEFNAKHKALKEEVVTRARSVMREYIGNKSNTFVIQMKFDRLKKDFFAAPTPELQERERILTSPKNFVFLYLDAKLRMENLELQKVIPKFDKDGKGFLSYDDFKRMMSSMGVKLNPTQIAEVIRGVDTDGDGFIDMNELTASLRDIDGDTMGIQGSPWKLYIDPAQDVICYHNFNTDERIFEYNMTDLKMKEINEANMLGEAEFEAAKAADAARVSGWEELMRDYMARRIQYMARQWRGRRKRHKRLWKVQARQLAVTRFTQQKVVKYIESFFVGWKSRESFRRQLHLTYEKAWDTSVEGCRMFYLNHETGLSTWERPLLLWRYGDVTTPTPWLPVEVPVDKRSPGPNPTVHSAVSGTVSSTVSISASRAGDGDDSSTISEEMYNIHYWHVTAKTDFHRKPDGLILCDDCHRNIAIHHCKQCTLDYCFTCHRSTHASPLGFRQRMQPTQDQQLDPSFLQRFKCSKHDWILSKPKKCNLCFTEKIWAGIHCLTCNMDLCRPCSRRIHEQKDKISHEYYNT